MFREQQRSKSGCQRCKKRRKKCDEVKPICSACRRWGFRCIWPQASANLTASSGFSTNKPNARGMIMPPNITGHGVVPFRDQAQLTLLRKFSAVYQSLICPLAGGQFSDLSSFVLVSLQTAWVRDAMNAFIGYMGSGGTPDKKMEALVLSNYQSAVVGLKDRLSHPLPEVEQFSVLVAATFLGLYESFGTGQAELVMAHFAAVTILFRSVLARSTPYRAVLPSHCIIFEVMLYNLASHSIFCPVPEAASDALDWIIRQSVFSQYETTGRPAYRLSPHLGGNFEYHYLILNITCYSRQDHSHKDRAQEVDAWLSQLGRLDRRLKNYYDDAPRVIAELFKAKYQLYGLALRIYCLKVRDHGLRASNPEVVSLVDEAIRMFKQGYLHGLHAAAISWPLLVVLCACSDHAAFHFLAQQIKQMETTFDRGHLRRLEAVVTKLRDKYKGLSDHAKDQDQDNFGILLHKQGLTVTYFEAAHS